MTTLLRFRQLLSASLQYRRQDVFCRIPPIRIWVELTNYCNLACVSCLRSLGRKSPVGYCEMDLFKKIADEAAGFVIDINFIGSGESLFHPRLHEMVAYAKARGIRTRLETNATILDSRKAENLIDAGLDFLSISFDGYTREQYESIRRGAGFDATLANIRGFLEIKQKKKSPTPYTIIQFIETPAFTDSSTDEKRRGFELNFSGLPLNGYRYVTPHRYAGRMSEKLIGVTHGFVKRADGSLFTRVAYSPCIYLWTGMQILWDGRVVSCCMDFYGDQTIGDARTQSLRDIWNGDRIMSLRKALRGKRPGNAPLCKACDILSQELFLGFPVKNLKDASLLLKEVLITARADFLRAAGCHLARSSPQDGK